MNICPSRPPSCSSLCEMNWGDPEATLVGVSGFRKLELCGSGRKASEWWRLAGDWSISINVTFAVNGHGSKSSHSPCSKTRHPAASTSQWRGGAMASSSIGYSLFSPTYISILKTPEPPTNPTTYCPTPNYSLSENVLFLSENFLPKIQHLDLKTPILEEFRGNSRLRLHSIPRHFSNM